MPIAQDILRILDHQKTSCRIPRESDEVEKDECMLSFDNPFSPDGLYTNLKSWQSYGREFVEKDSEKSQHQIYLFQKFYKHLKPETKESNETTKTPSLLGLGIENGFSGNDDSIELERQYFICVLPSFTLVELTEKDLPTQIAASAQAIIAHKGAAAKATDIWVPDIKESKYSNNLVQLKAGSIRVSPNPKDWQCAECGETKNLWLNLSDAYVGCGRQQFGGSGGCGASLRHFEHTGRTYPLAVKLGTITTDGADVFSYEEDDLVKDSALAQHLSHWGIDIMKLQKTDKTMEELDIDLNKGFILGFVLETRNCLVYLCFFLRVFDDESIRNGLQFACVITLNYIFETIKH
ncbi:hypothetical protein RFI_13030 [Reticulomyxa filosa]|uniref:UBP-type domain-containing protein n=1 Tax=Reticulomyxa filosa TaxID=46433 RepID=X6NDP7_RETFI|nr:hypothetical protein RFI_13030 [Reticulomyxa filosa]|eukprot:ETO24126.1 hypothetical protein RFI_13030 [Reticulomyxa filosa]